jgi:FtsZ-interacting cell division protein YlmF
VREEALVLASIANSVVTLSCALVILSGARSWRRKPAPIRRGTRRRQSNEFDALTRANDFESILGDALKINSYRVGKDAPGVRLQEVARFVPSFYDEAVEEIARNYKRGWVISIDLGHADRREAIRIVDFCSGMATTSGGWIHRVATNVLLVAPGSS